jgi:hypothetical protein
MRAGNSVIRFAVCGVCSYWVLCIDPPVVGDARVSQGGVRPSSLMHTHTIMTRTSVVRKPQPDGFFDNSTGVYSAGV